MDRLKLSAFIDWISEPRETFRAILARGEAPFAKDREGDKQRTYDGADLLAWCLFTMLRNTGMGTREAGPRVHLSGAIGQFFKARERGEDTSDWHLVTWCVLRERDGKRVQVWHQTHGTSNEIAGILKQESEGYGQPTYSGDVRMGVVSFIAVPMMPCYHRCQATAEAQGFKMKGADLVEIEA